MRIPFSLRVVPSPVSYCFVETAEEAVVSVADAAENAAVTVSDDVVISAATACSVIEDSTGEDSVATSVCTAKTVFSVTVTLTEVW